MKTKKKGGIALPGASLAQVKGRHLMRSANTTHDLYSASAQPPKLISRPAAAPMPAPAPAPARTAETGDRKARTRRTSSMERIKISLLSRLRPGRSGSTAPSSAISMSTSMPIASSLKKASPLLTSLINTMEMNTVQDHTNRRISQPVESGGSELQNLLDIPSKSHEESTTTAPPSTSFHSHQTVLATAPFPHFVFASGLPDWTRGSLSPLSRGG